MIKAIIITLASLFVATAFAGEPAKKDEKKAEATKTEKQVDKSVKTEKKTEAKK